MRERYQTIIFPALWVRLNDVFLYLWCRSIFHLFGIEHVEKVELSVHRHRRRQPHLGERDSAESDSIPASVTRLYFSIINMYPCNLIDEKYLRICHLIPSCVLCQTHCVPNDPPHHRRHYYPPFVIMVQSLLISILILFIFSIWYYFVR